MTFRADNGIQHTGREFRSSAATMGITLEYICVNTPEQNGHIESLHKTLKVRLASGVCRHEAKGAPDAAFVDCDNHGIHFALKYLAVSEFTWRHRQGSGGAIHGITGAMDVNRMPAKTGIHGRSPARLVSARTDTAPVCERPVGHEPAHFPGTDPVNPSGHMTSIMRHRTENRQGGDLRLVCYRARNSSVHLW